MIDQTQNQSSEKKEYKEMPPIEEFETLDSKTQEELISKFPVLEDQEEEKSETQEPESEVKTEDQTESNETSDESSKEDNQSKKQDDDLANKYKNLEAEFTRRSQKLRELEKKVEDMSKVNKGQESEVKSPLEKLVEINPNAKELVEAIRQEVELKLGKGLEREIKPIQERMTQKQSEENFGIFQKEVSEFLSSSLGKLEPEFNEIAAEVYGDQETLLSEAKKNPDVFKNLKKEVLARHFVKAAKLMGETITPEDKTNKIKNLGVSGKPKTTVEVDDELDLKVFNGKSSEEMEKILAKHGAVKKS